MNRLTGILKNYLHEQQALRYRNYRLYISGQGLSVIGNAIQRVAMMWLAYRITNSAFLLGLVTFSEQIPILFLAPVAGVYADRWDRRKALIWIEALNGLQALGLAALVFLGTVNIYHLVLLSLLLGFINSFEIPLRQSFVVEIVDNDKKALPDAIAFNSMTFNISRMIGPALGGLLISGVGEAWCFIFNAVSYLAIVVSLLLMNIKKIVGAYPVTKRKVIRELRLGMRYIERHKTLKSLLFLLASVSLSNAAIRTLGPVFAKEVLHGDAGTYGLLMSAVGVGAIVGAVYLSKGREMALLTKIVSYTSLVLGAGIIGFSFSAWLPLSMVILAFCGLARMLHTTSTNTLLQVATDDDKRGRVMSFYAVCLQGMTPVGGLISGSLAGLLGGPLGMLIMGGFCLTAGLLFRGNKRLGHLRK